MAGRKVGVVGPILVQFSLWPARMIGVQQQLMPLPAGPGYLPAAYWDGLWNGVGGLRVE